ncbi:MAG: hypothetical protein JWM68_1967 [Verrucomicrobiales bacterium]|nr:hypothetical protein [Verrucomicrobiales bacterium]
MVRSLKLSTLPVLAALAGAGQTHASQDYGPAEWLASCDYSVTGGTRHFAVIHDIEGYYESCISRFHATCTSGHIYVSAHFVVNGRVGTGNDSKDNPEDGTITQMVRESNYSWHARCWNSYMFGTEHEGFANNPAWYTDAMYQASGALQRHLCDKFPIAKDRNHIIAHGQKAVSGWAAYINNNYSYIDPYCNSHTDPGPFWNWNKFMDIVTQANSKPEDPTDLKAVALDAHRVQLTWSDNSWNENTFRVEQSTSFSGPFNEIGTTQENDSKYTDTGLACGTKYFYRIRARNANGNSSYTSVENDTTIDCNPPAAPTGLTAVAVNDDKITLAWTDNSSTEDGFKILQSTDGTNFTEVASIAINATGYNATGLKGNRTYWYRVKSFDTAGASGASNTASDTTGPTAPTGLTANAVSSSKINLAWTDLSGAEAGYKIERALASGGPWTAIFTNAASDPSYSDTGLNASTTYWYRVRAFNGNANSLYSNTDSATTQAIPPVLSAIADQTVTVSNTLTFTAASTDPNHLETSLNWFNLTGYTDGDNTVLFKKPEYVGATAGFIDTTVTNYSQIRTSYPAGHTGPKVLKTQWNFKTGTTNPYVQLSTDAANFSHPTLAFGQSLRFDVYCTKDISIGFSARETFTTAAIGADGGTSGAFEWVGVTNVIGSCPQPSLFIAKSNWVTVTLNMQTDPVMIPVGGGNGANGVVEGNKGAFANILIVPATSTMGKYECYFDNFKAYTNNTLTYSLSNAPAGASIGYKTGIFSWTPTGAQAGLYTVSVLVTDQFGYTDVKTFKITVTAGANNAPVLAAIGNKSVKEGIALAFTATAIDPDGGQTKTFTLDAGAPAGASINSGSGAFTWTPTEAQGPGSYPITIRVTDNGSPAKNDFETITVTVTEANVAPVVAAITDKTVNEGSNVSFTATATDADLPANAITWSLDSGAPAGATINAGSGAFSWTPTEAQGPDTYIITVRATDNGTPVLSGTKSFNVTVNEVNIAPVLSVPSANISTTTNWGTFKGYANGTENGTVLFREPTYASTTSGFLDPTVDISQVTGGFPTNGNNSARALWTSFKIKTGQTSPWVRLTTGNNTSLGNPTVGFDRHLKFDVYTDKTIKIGIGLRENNSAKSYGADGGIAGQPIEWVGVTGITGTQPQATRTISAGVWTTVDFNIPSEPVTADTGNGVLNSTTGKGGLQYAAIIPLGTGIYNVYFDNFKCDLIQTNFTINAWETLTFTSTASDADLPSQGLTFSLDSGAPTNAFINPTTGEFSWTPANSDAGTNNITIRVTDALGLSASQVVPVIVKQINSAPFLELPFDTAQEVTAGSTVTWTNIAWDAESNSLTFSLVSPPVGATINPTTGVFTWTPPSVIATNYVTIRVTDNGVPVLYTEQIATIVVTTTNTAPTLSLSTAKIYETFASFETFANNTGSGTVMFRQPNFSSTTTNFLTTATNYTKITNSFPAGNTNGGTKVLVAAWTFKTGTSNYWVRLSTASAANLPSPIVDLSQSIRLSIYSTKSLKVGLGLRETASSGAIGSDGGISGNIEYVGVTNVISGAPIPNRVVNASNWTTLEWNLPTEQVRAFTGDGVLASGKGVLEHLILAGNGGTGAYTVYVDQFQVVTSTSSTNISMNTGSTLTFTALGSDIDAPAQPLGYALDPDANTNAVINGTNGIFSYTPPSTDAGTTNVITVYVEDVPANGSLPKTAQKTITVAVTADPFGAQSAPEAVVSGQETVTLTWDSQAGRRYQVQYKLEGDNAQWTNVGAPITATHTTSSLVVSNEQERLYRIIAVDAEQSSDQ